MMRPQPLSSRTRKIVELLIAPCNQSAAAEMLINRCGNNLPFLEKKDMFELERFRFAALKLSDGKMELLGKAVDLAQRDWRDLLMAAGFGNADAHNQWFSRLEDSPRRQSK